MIKLTGNKIMFIFIIFFPLSTILQGLPAMNSINRIIIGVLLLTLLFNTLINEITVKQIFVLLIVAVLYAFSFYYSKGKDVRINDILYFVFWTLYLIYIKNNYDSFLTLFKVKLQWVKWAVVLWSGVVVISAFMPSSYDLRWGGEFYFRSFASGQHRFASSCVLIMALVWIYIQLTKSKLNYLYFVIPIIGILLCGARTYLAVLVAIILAVFFLSCKKKTFYISLIPMMALIGVLIMFTPMGEKILTQFNTENSAYDALGRFTNGRSVFWGYEIEEFNKLPILKRIVGNGFNFVYEVNIARMGINIWAHNDFLNILLNYGYSGVLLYLLVLWDFIKSRLKRNKLGFILFSCFFITWFFNAMFNMVYTYTCTALAVPLLYMSFEKVNFTKLESDNGSNS